MGHRRFGDLEIRLARSAAEIDAAQALRYRVFYDELGATPTAPVARRRRDFDEFDGDCDHLLVVDRERPRNRGVVGTYRLMRRSQAARRGGFYTAREFDLSPLMAFPGEIMELGRSCVDPDYRNRAVVRLLWLGIADYVARHDVGVMFGCGSIHGTDPADLANVLTYLYHHHLAPEPLRPRALDGRFVDMSRVSGTDLDVKAALADLPPLIKGYLRLGGDGGDGAVVDHQFNTVDVCIVVRSDRVTDRYYRHFMGAGAPARPEGREPGLAAA